MSYICICIYVYIDRFVYLHHQKYSIYIEREMLQKTENLIFLWNCMVFFSSNWWPSFLGQALALASPNEDLEPSSLRVPRSEKRPLKQRHFVLRKKSAKAFCCKTTSKTQRSKICQKKKNDFVWVKNSKLLFLDLVTSIDSSNARHPSRHAHSALLAWFHSRQRREFFRWEFEPIVTHGSTGVK